MSIQKLTVVVGQLLGHTTLRADMFKLGLTQRQECRLSDANKEYSVRFVCHCPTLECNRHRTLGLMF